MHLYRTSISSGGVLCAGNQQIGLITVHKSWQLLTLSLISCHRNALLLIKLSLSSEKKTKNSETFFIIINKLKIFNYQ